MKYTNKIAGVLAVVLLAGCAPPGGTPAATTPAAGTGVTAAAFPAEISGLNGEKLNTSDAFLTFYHAYVQPPQNFYYDSKTNPELFDFNTQTFKGKYDKHQEVQKIDGQSGKIAGLEPAFMEYQIVPKNSPEWANTVTRIDFDGKKMFKGILRRSLKNPPEPGAARITFDPLDSDMPDVPYTQIDLTNGKVKINTDAAVADGKSRVTYSPPEPVFYKNLNFAYIQNTNISIDLTQQLEVVQPEFNLDKIFENAPVDDECQEAFVELTAKALKFVCGDGIPYRNITCTVVDIKKL